jgi:hypothetical protein
VSAKRKRGKKTSSLTARNADKHSLYEQSVQAPEADIRFALRMHRKHAGRTPTKIREDFCGTALLACEWAEGGSENQVWGVDLDQPTLDWGDEHNRQPLGDPASRVHLVNGDVRDTKLPKVEVNFALNFSYFIFQERQDLIGYFRAARANLKEDGILILDAFGGSEAMETLEESTEKEGFTYVWDQDDFDPVNSRIRCFIHFEFEDGSRMKRAFSYDWRMWSIKEIRECLADAGFRGSEVYWEGFDEDGEGNGVFRKVEKTEPCEGYVAYVVGLR